MMENVYLIRSFKDHAPVLQITGTWRRVEKVVYLLRVAGYAVYPQRADRAASTQLKLPMEVK